MVAFLISAVIATSSALGAWGVIETQKIKDDSHTYRKLRQPVQNPAVSRSIKSCSKNGESNNAQEESSTDISQTTGIRRRKGKDPQDIDQSATITPTETSSSTNIHSTNSTPNKSPVKVLSANISTYFERNAEAAALYSSIIFADENNLNNIEDKSLDVERNVTLASVAHDDEGSRQAEQMVQSVAPIDAKVEETSQQTIIKGRVLFSRQLDLMLRSKKQFDSTKPLQFEWIASNLAKECDKLRTAYNSKYQDCIPESTLDFITTSQRFIYFPAKRAIRLKYLTPYQGDAKVHGEFLCPKCSRPWKIVTTLKDTAYKCVSCHTPSYPYKQIAEEDDLTDNLQ
jgi:hypothetical protein